jgi:cytochrome c5
MLKRKAFLISIIVAALVVLLLVNIAWNFNLGALQKPGKAETFVATKAKHWLVARAVAREGLAAEPSTASLSVASGRSLFEACCSMCLDQISTTQADGKGMPATGGDT